jgi:hypothetical protein
MQGCMVPRCPGQGTHQFGGTVLCGVCAALVEAEHG